MRERFCSRIRGIQFCLVLLLELLVVLPAKSQITVYKTDFINTALQPQTLLTPVFTAAYSNYVSQPPGFATGSTGLGYHYGISLADNVQGKFLRKFLFAAAAHQRDQYCIVGDAPKFPKRLGNVLLHSIFSIPQASHRVNLSALPASLASAALSNVYQPNEQRTLSATMSRFGTNSAGYLLSDVISEFKFGHRVNVVVSVAIGTR